MSDFDTNRAALVQEHFSIIEIDLPEITGTCTLPAVGGTGYGTPLTCDEAWNETDFKTYYFSTDNLPTEFGRPRTSSGLPGDVIEIVDPIHPVVDSISESPTQLKPGEGLAVTAIATVNFMDFLGDPGPSSNTTTEGTYFGKYSARNVFENKTIRIKHFHKSTDGIYAESDALVREYLIDTLQNNGNGKFTLRASDDLTKTEKDKNQFPAPTGGTIRTDVDDTVQIIPVDITTDWEEFARPYTVKIGDELMKVASVTDNQGAGAALNVGVRGGDITYTNVVSQTDKDSHSVGDAVQICHTSDQERIDDLLEVICLAAGIDASKLPTADWAAEVDEWQSGTRIDAVWHEPRTANMALKRVLNDYLFDMWYDPIDVEVKLSAISVWKIESVTLFQGKQINRNTFKIQQEDDKRFSRAFISLDKPFQVRPDDIENFRALSIFINATLEEPGLYGEPKAKEFSSSPIIDSTSADLLCQRYVSRFGVTPEKYTWDTEEKFLDYAVGDIVAIDTPEKQDFDGSNKLVRAQILKILPKVTRIGRSYKTTALTYEPAFADGTEFDITGDNQNLNLHTQAGAPSGQVDVTFVFDGGSIGSTTSSTAAIVAGNFASGSTITIIFTNSTDGQGGGGKGGNGGSIIPGPPFLIPGASGDSGGTVYDAQGIDTDIHLGGIISSHTSLGTLKAPGGGGGGETPAINPGGGGGGGAGSDPGNGGSKGFALGAGSSTDGSPGDTSGNGGSGSGTAGDGGDWGLDGVAGSPGGGAGTAGKGIVKGGATVNIFTDGNTGRFVNGSGDTPDSLT